MKSETAPTYLGSQALTRSYQFGVSGKQNGALSGIKLGTGSLYNVVYGYDDRLRLNSIAYNSVAAFNYTFVTNSNLIDTFAQGTSSSAYKRHYDYETNSNRPSEVKHFWNSSTPTTDTKLTYDPASGLRNTEGTKGTAYTGLLRPAANPLEPGVHIDYSYDSRYELNSSGKYILALDPNDSSKWSAGSPRLDTARDYSFDPAANRDQTYGYSVNALNQYTAAPGFGTFGYDANGNITGDGLRTYEYDAENRLIKVTQGASVWNYTYDYLGRRIGKKSGAVETRFLYDRWNVVAELNGGSTLTRRFVWSLDASGSLQGAGGIGGLIVLDADAVANGTNQYYPIYDGSSDVIGLFNSSGILAAAYEYDGFGNLQTIAGSYASLNPFRSATKYTDQESGFVYYGMRYYSPQLGRFINRDPIEEQGGLNLYGFCSNDGVNRFDLLGMTETVNGPTGEPYGVTESRGKTAEDYEHDHNLEDTIRGLNSERQGSQLFKGTFDFSIINMPVAQSVVAGLQLAVRQAITNRAKAGNTRWLEMRRFWATYSGPDSGGLRRDSQERDGLSLHEGLNGNSAEAVAKTNELLVQLAGTKGRFGGPTQGAVYLEWLRKNGFAELVVYKGAMDETWALDANGRRAPERQKYGEYSMAQIVFDPYSKDALSGLAHEITHAYLLNRGLQQSGHMGEYEPTRVENEIRAIYLGLSPLTTHKGTEIPNPEYYLNPRN